MRTTIRLNDQLLSEAKQVAAQTGRTLTSIIEDALRESLAKRHKAPVRERVRLITGGSGGVHPGVNLDSNAALLDLMEAPDDPG
jgi:hypothetical protein